MREIVSAEIAVRGSPQGVGDGDAALFGERREVARIGGREDRATVAVLARRALEKIFAFECASIFAKAPNTGSLDAQELRRNLRHQLQRARHVPAAQRFGVHQRGQRFAMRIEDVLDLTRVEGGSSIPGWGQVGALICPAGTADCIAMIPSAHHSFNDPSSRFR